MTIDGNRMARRRSGAGPWIAMALTCGGLVVADLALVRNAFLTLGASYRDVVSADAASQLYELPGAEPRFDSLRLRWRFSVAFRRVDPRGNITKQHANAYRY